MDAQLTPAAGPCAGELPPPSDGLPEDLPDLGPDNRPERYPLNPADLLHFGPERDPATVDWVMMQATPLFAAAYAFASPPIRRAVQRAYVGITPEGMLEALELLGSDVQMPEIHRGHAWYWADALRLAHVALPEVQ